MVAIRPLGDRVVIRPIEEGEKMYGSIVVPKLSADKPQQGEVLAVGPGRVTEHPAYDAETSGCCEFIIVPRVTVGQKVLFGRYAGTEVEIDNVKYLLIKEQDILAVLEDAESSSGCVP